MFQADCKGIQAVWQCIQAGRQCVQAVCQWINQLFDATSKTSLQRKHTLLRRYKIQASMKWFLPSGFLFDRLLFIDFLYLISAPPSLSSST